MEALLVPAAAVALAEIGDKTQLLAFLLAARFRSPLPILAGMAVATLANHGIAGALGGWIAATVDAQVLRWILGGGFLAMAVWMLVPDKADDAELGVASGLGVFTATLIAFFLAEMGDKTQIATVALAMHYDSAVAVVVGTTLGLMAVNAPAVFLGDRFAQRIPMRLVHIAAAVLFALFGIAALSGAGGSLWQ
ncbi:MAG: TMEM165/GDT1 family protein [Gammaproteobacteria bacterium]|nr:TMEM165/GDT1 family protein [Gammaproteobacteria bacterium]